MLFKTQVFPAIRPLKTLVALAALTLSGCSQVYDDTKGWGNDVEAWFREDVLAPIGAEMRGEDYPPRTPEAEPALVQGTGEGASQTAAETAASPMAKTTVVASTDARLPAATAAPSEKPQAANPAKADADGLGVKIYPQTAGKTARAAEMKKAEGKMMKAETATAAKPAAAAMALHLSSNKSKDSAMREWSQLKSAFPEQLGGLDLNIARTDLGKKGVFFRVMAGPFQDKPAAAQICAQLKKKQQYCAVMPVPKKTG